MSELSSLEADAWITTLGDVVKRAIHTLWALKDPDARYLSAGSAWLFPVTSDDQEVWQMYGSRKWPFIPLPEDVSRMERVAVWLAWLRREHTDQALRRLIGWSLAVPTWVLAKREGCTERTILNRIDRSLAAILDHFGGIAIEIEAIDELGKPGRYFVKDRPEAIKTGVIETSPLTYVHGKGQMQNGKLKRRQNRAAWQDGSEYRFLPTPWQR